MRYNKTVYPKSYISSAQSLGTTYYKLSKDDVEDHISSMDNMIFLEAFRIYGWDSLDLKNMFGSVIGDDDFLYLCVTDGYDININGEDVDPEDAINKYGLEECSGYIKEGKPDDIGKNITEYEFNDKIDLDEVALSLLQSGHHFSKLVSDAKDIGLI